MSLRLGQSIRVWSILTVLSVLMLQGLLSSDVSLGRLLFPSSTAFSEMVLNQIWNAVKFSIFIPAIAAWFFDRRALLRKCMIISTTLLTIELIGSTTLLVLRLRAFTLAVDGILIQDTILVILINLLIFSLWYWIIDHPCLKKELQSEQHDAWDFLFPQRGDSIPGYGNWAPSYIDYLFLAFTTAFTFAPGDTLPLSGRAKALMTLQSLISLVNIMVLIGYSLNLLNT